MRNLLYLLIVLLSGCARINIFTTVRDAAKVVCDLPRHNNIIYVNRNSITEDFFQAAETTLENGHIYIVLSSTGSPAANLISTFTQEQFAHTSLAFDEDLRTIVSYNGGNGLAAPGLNQEQVGFFYQKENACFAVFELPASRLQKEIMLQEIRKINETGSSYNIMGLFMPIKLRENVMYCSQFVYIMLQKADLAYFEIKPEEVTPIDFIERDDQKKLKFCRKVYLRELSEFF